MNTENVGECGHAKCAGGVLCYQKGKAMRTYESIKKELAHNITTQDEARQYAIDWQRGLDDRRISYGELVNEQAYLVELAERFDLVEEFKENAII